MFRVLILFAWAIYLTSCGNTQEAEFYGDLLTSEGGLTLTRNEHPTGWKQSQCFLCHHPDNIHQVDNVADLDLDLDQIKELVDRDGIKSCKACHGPNGVQE